MEKKILCIAILLILAIGIFAEPAQAWSFSSFSRSVSRAVSSVSRAVRSVSRSVSRAVSSVSRSVSRTVSRVSRSISRTISSVSRAVNSFTRSVSTAATKAAKSISGFVRSVGSSIRTSAGNAVRSVSSTVNGWFSGRSTSSTTTGYQPLPISESQTNLILPNGGSDPVPIVKQEDTVGGVVIDEDNIPEDVPSGDKVVYYAGQYYYVPSKTFKNPLNTQNSLNMEAASLTNPQDTFNPNTGEETSENPGTPDWMLPLAAANATALLGYGAYQYSKRDNKFENETCYAPSVGRNSLSDESANAAYSGMGSWFGTTWRSPNIELFPKNRPPGVDPKGVKLFTGTGDDFGIIMTDTHPLPGSQGKPIQHFNFKGQGFNTHLVDLPYGTSSVTESRVLVYQDGYKNIYNSLDDVNLLGKTTVTMDDLATAAPSTADELTTLTAPNMFTSNLGYTLKGGAKYVGTSTLKGSAIALPLVTSINILIGAANDEKPEVVADNIAADSTNAILSIAAGSAAVVGAAAIGIAASPVLIAAGVGILASLALGVTGVDQAIVDAVKPFVPKEVKDFAVSATDTAMDFVDDTLFNTPTEAEIKCMVESQTKSTMTQECMVMNGLSYPSAYSVGI